MLESNHAVHGEDVDLFQGGPQKALEWAFLTQLMPFLQKIQDDREYRGEYRIRIQWLSDTDIEQERLRRTKVNTMKCLKCDKCKKPCGDTVVMVLSEGLCVGLKMCLRCAKRFFRKS